MHYDERLARARDLPVVESRVLRAFAGDKDALSVQLSRWVSTGKLTALRRGVYLLPPELRRIDPPPEYLANILVTPSYVSFERALAIQGHLPEHVPLVQS